MALPKNEKQFSINVIGETSGERFMGEFTCVCVPNAGMRNRISRDEIRETGDLNNITSELFIRSRWLVNVRHRLFQSPDWWRSSGNGDLLLDENVIESVYNQCIEAETEWRAEVKKRSDEAVQATSTVAPQAQ